MKTEASCDGSATEKAGANEIVVYQPNEVMRLEVRLENDTIWLTQEQIAQLFGTKRPAITKHLANIYISGELEERSTCSILEHMGQGESRSYRTKFYNLDAILSVGYRVNSRGATMFRRWATSVLREYLLRGYSVNMRIDQLEDRTDRRLAEQSSRISVLEGKVDYFVKTAIPPVQGVFYDGQVFDSKVFSAKDSAAKAKASAALKMYQGVYNLVWDGGMLTISVAAKGKARVTGTIGSVKVSGVSSQLLVGDGCACVPVVITKKAKLSFNLWIEGGKVEVDGVGGVHGAPALPGLAIGKAGMTMGTKVSVGALPSGHFRYGDAKSEAMKLKFTAKTGAIKGSFKVYTMVNGKPKKVPVAVTGVQIGNVSYCTGVIKKVGSMPVLVE